MATFLESQMDASVDVSVSAPSLPGFGTHAALSIQNARNAVYNWGPETDNQVPIADRHILGQVYTSSTNNLVASENQPSDGSAGGGRDQCIFLRGLHVKTRFPWRIRAAAGPHNFDHHGRDRSLSEISSVGRFPIDSSTLDVESLSGPQEVRMHDVGPR